MAHVYISSSGHLEPIFPRKILNVGIATPAVLLLQIDTIWPKSRREFREVIISRTLTKGRKLEECHFGKGGEPTPTGNPEALDFQWLYCRKP